MVITTSRSAQRRRNENARRLAHLVVAVARGIRVQWRALGAAAASRCWRGSTCVALAGSSAMWQARRGNQLSGDHEVQTPLAPRCAVADRRHRGHRRRTGARRRVGVHCLRIELAGGPRQACLAAQSWHSGPRRTQLARFPSALHSDAAACRAQRSLEAASLHLYARRPAFAAAPQFAVRSRVVGMIPAAIIGHVHGAAHRRVGVAVAVCARCRVLDARALGQHSRWALQAGAAGVAGNRRRLSKAGGGGRGEASGS